MTITSLGPSNKTYRRNVRAMIAWEALWALGVSSCLIVTVVPSYLLALGSSKLWVQCVMVGMGLGAFFQFQSVRWIGSGNRKIRIFAAHVLFCGCWLLYGALALWAGDAISPTGKIAVFSAMCAALAVALHLGTPAYVEMVVENVPLHRRGLVGSLRMFALGFFGFFGVALTHWIMRQWGEPNNFEYAMVIGAAIMSLSCLTLLPIRDLAECRRAPESGMAGVRVSLRALFHNLNFRFFIVFYAMLLCAQTLAPLFIGYAVDVLDVSSKATSYFTAAHFGGALLVAVSISRLADRYGFRLVAMLSCLVMAVAFLLPLISGRSVTVLFVSYLLVGGSLSLNGIILPNIGAEIAPDIKPGMIFAVGTLVVMPLGLVVAPLAGRLADAHAQAGYLAVFLMGATLSLCAAMGYAVIVREPRSGQELHIRIRTP